MPALGLALALSKSRSSQSAAPPPNPPPTGFAAVNDLQAIKLSWDTNSYAENLLYFNFEDDFGTSNQFTSTGGGTSTYAFTTTENASPASLTNKVTGTKYWFWIAGGDGAGNPITDPSASVSGRAFFTLANSGITAMYVPNSATLNLEDLFFGNTTTPVGIIVQFDGNEYGSIGGGDWEDINTADPANTVPITGQFTISNSSGGAYTFWDTEP